MYTQIHNLVYDYHLLILAILTTQAAIPNGRYEPKVPEWASLSYHNVYTEDFLNRKIWETIDWERILMAHFGLLSRYLARKRSGYWWKGCSPLPLKRGAISLHPIQKQWRHYMTSSLQNNVNEIRCNHDAYDDVFPITLLWPLAFYYPIVDDNRTNDWLPCCMAEMDRSWRTGWMEQGNNARTVTRHCVGSAYKATASPSVNYSLNHEGYTTYLQW